jgi:hypothetical protein
MFSASNQMPLFKPKAATLPLITPKFNIMPYGKGGRLGEGIDPRLMQVDYSGYADVGRTQGQAFANMGAQIGDVIKQHGENQKSIKATETTLKAMEKNFAGTPVGKQASDLLQKFYDPDMSTRDKLAIRDSINQVLQIGISGMEQQRQQQMLELKKQELNAKAGGGAMNPASIRATLDFLKASGYGAQSDSLERSLAAASTPEEVAGVYRLIAQVGDSIAISKLGVPDPSSTAYKISGTPSMVPKGDKKVAEWEVIAPDGRKFTVNAEEKERLNRAIQSGQPVDLKKVLGEPSVVSRGVEFIRNIFGDAGEKYGEENKPPRTTSLEEREAAFRRVIELREKALKGDEEAAKEAASIENALNSGGFFGGMELTDWRKLVETNPFADK